MASQTSPPAPDPGQQPDPEAQRITSLDERFGKIEHEQAEQRGILDKVLAAVGGSPKAPATAGSATPSDDGGGGSIAEQVRRGVEEIEARKQREADEKAARDADTAWRAKVEERLPEQKPAEPAPGRKARLQRWLVGPP